MTAPTRPLPDGFAESFACFDRLVGFLDGEAASALSHAELEERLDRDGRDLLRHLLQDHLDLRASREARLADVLDAAGMAPSKRVTSAFLPACSAR